MSNYGNYKPTNENWFKDLEDKKGLKPELVKSIQDKKKAFTNNKPVKK